MFDQEGYKINSLDSSLQAFHTPYRNFIYEGKQILIKKKFWTLLFHFIFLFVFAVTVNIIWLHVCKLCKINRLFSQGVKKQHFLKCYIISVDCASLNDSLVSFFLKSIFVKWWLLNNTAVRAIRAHKLSFIINDFSNNQLSICTFQKISWDESWIRMQMSFAFHFYWRTPYHLSDYWLYM